MNATQFKTKWAKFAGKESAAYQEHFNDLCQLLAHPTPVEADPTGEESFCFQKRVVKDAELFVVTSREADAPYEPAEHGFADVWKKDCFAWEYKGKRKNLDDAYQQLLRYREALLNPPLLVVCDFDRFIIRTNFNGAVQRTHEFSNAEIDRPENLKLLRALFTAPETLRPDRTTRQVTEELARKIAEVARLLQSRECVELGEARTRREHDKLLRQNVLIAQFLNRLTFCFFAEDVGLLPKGVFSEVLKGGQSDPRFFAEHLEALFHAMSGGGSFGPYRIRHFNGHLFDEATVFELMPDEIAALGAAADADWQYIEPTIFGTLFERALDAEQRTQLGAHYTSAEDILTLVEPVLMAPLRREWKEIKRDLLADYRAGKGSPKARKALDGFLKRLRTTVVLDPACGSGNFLYLSLQLLLSIEKEVIAFAAQLGFLRTPEVDVHQLRAIETNPYAFELAQVSVQIGYLQWMRDNGFAVNREPVLQVLEGFRNADALMAEVFHRPRKLKEAKAAEHTTEVSAKGYVERDWPECDVIVSNPPFLGDKLMRRQLGDDYVTALRQVYEGRIPGQADLCCYWFEKARAQIEERKCRRAGLLATQNIRGLANREVLKRIMETGQIFFAESDRPWVLAGANLHISMVAFDDGSEEEKVLDGVSVKRINANLTKATDVVDAVRLITNCGRAFIGSCKGGSFDISDAEALALLVTRGNPHLKPNSDVVRPVANSDDLLKTREQRWIIDNAALSLELAGQYEGPHKMVVERVKPHRDNNRDKWLRDNWWRPQRMRPEMRLGIGPLSRFFVTPTTSKHRVFIWMSHPVLPDHKLTVFAFHDNVKFGILHSRFHEVWALCLGTRLETRPNYTPTTCFETFPFPSLDPRPSTLDPVPSISAAAKGLNDLRERWLNPPEWTKTEVLEFPGTVGGPWDRYIDPATAEDRGGFKVGTVKYPRQVPCDEDCAAKLKKRTLTNLYNERPAWLDLAHRQLDEAVAAAYGWPVDLTDEQILERLLALNLERADAERRAGCTAKRFSRAKRDDELL